MSETADGGTGAQLERQLERLDPYMATLVARATRRALRLHAESVSVEHMIGAAMEDEDCAAYAVVEHAFADPETLSQEMLALSTGIMVVGSGAALPFSVRALEALNAAHAAAAGGAVDPEAVLAHAVRALPDAARAALDAAGLAPEAASPGSPTAAGAAGEHGGSPGASSGSSSGTGFFARFTDPAKAALSRANKRASLDGEPSIGPARLVLACLESDPALAQRAGFGGGAVGARQALRGHTRDDTPVAERELAPEPQLVEFLAALPEGSGSLAALSACHGERGTPEMAELLRRHMVTPALLERSVEAFADPD